MPPGASASGLLAEPQFQEALRDLGVDPENAVMYRGRVRERLETYAAPARRLGITVDFVQAYHHGKLARFLLIHDPVLPGRLAHSVRLLNNAVDWPTAMTEAGLIAAPRERKPPPGRYVECPDCAEYDLGLACPTCKGKGLVPSSDDS